MESILAKALEYTLRYWLKSFSRDQFKLQGRTVQLSNLDLNGDALHASAGLPPALTVTTAKVGKLEIQLPSVSSVQTEPIVVQVDKLDLVFEENPDVDPHQNPTSTQSSNASSKGGGYGFSDKIADGMSLEVNTVNVLLVTRGGARRKGGATWAAPMASITIHKLFLYTTNENWQVVNLKEARDFSANKGFIYVFKKLEWESLSVDLLPHPDMFTDATLGHTKGGENQRDDDGAKRVFFGGERFMEGISGQAYITVQRTEQNSPLGLEVQVHVTEAVCPALSEPGLRAFLRFLTGLYVCLNRGDVDIKAQRRSAEAAGRSLVSIMVDHIFLCIKDTEFQLELLMQSLSFSRASVSNGDNENTLTKVMIAGVFLRDTSMRPPCTLVQPSIQAFAKEMHVPEFGKNFCPPIYPLGKQPWQHFDGVPIILLHSLQVKPSPLPPSFATQTVIDCQPLEVYLQEESCLRIFSFLADGIVVNPGDISPDFSLNSLKFLLKGLDITVPVGRNQLDKPISNGDTNVGSSFSGAKLHIENLYFTESPSLKLNMLQLEKDPSCFMFWEGQPIDASQKKWTSGASNLSLSLDSCSGLAGQSSLELTSSSLKCVELKDGCVEVAMATVDGKPLKNVPPPGGIVRVGIACQQYLSNTSVEQLFFVLDLYGYFGRVSEKIALVGKTSRAKTRRNESFSKMLMDKVPSDTAVRLAVKDIQLRFLESSTKDVEGLPLVQFGGDDFSVQVSHRTLGGAIAVSSTVRWESIEVDCVDTDGNLSLENGRVSICENDIVNTRSSHSQLRAVLWVNNKRKHHMTANTSMMPFLDVSMTHIVPFNEQDIESHSVTMKACISGVRLGGGMNYTEALLHRFGVLGPDGRPGEGLSRGLENLSQGPLSKIFQGSPLAGRKHCEDTSSGIAKNSSLIHLGRPDDVDVSIELRDWLFALEGATEMADGKCINHGNVDRVDRCWHTTFESLQVKAKSSPRNGLSGEEKLLNTKSYPIEAVTVGIGGLQALKPQVQTNLSPQNGNKETFQTSGGINVDVRMAVSGDNIEDEMAKWVVENFKFSVKQPIEAIVTKNELQYLAFLCKSEVDSLGRITAGVLRLLKLENSFGQAAIDQLSNLGSGGLDKIFSLEKPSEDNATGNTAISSPSKLINGSRDKVLESTLSTLQDAINDSQTKCAAISAGLDGSESTDDQTVNIKQLMQQLDSMQELMKRLRAQM